METGLSIQRHGSVKYEIYEKIKGAYRIDMGCERLEKNLIDIIKEEQAKLGFRKEEIRLYYPLISLNHFFEAEDDVDEMQTRLEQFPEEVKGKLGDIRVTHKKDRFCLHIPEQGSVYVRENTAEN